MLEKLDLSKILFLDIETVPQFADHALLDEDTRALRDHKAAPIGKEGQTEDEVYERVHAGVIDEHGQVWEALLYRIPPDQRHVLSDRPWDAARFRSDTMGEFVRMCDRYRSDWLRSAG